MKSLLLWLLSFCLICLTAPIRSGAEELTMSWQLPIPGLLPQAIAVSEKDDSILFGAIKSGGIVVLKTSHNGQPPITKATIGKPLLGDMDAMNLFLQGKYLFVALGDFFRSRTHAGMAIIDVRRPSRPRVLSVWKSPTKLHGCTSVVANGNKAFLGGMSKGVLVLDIRDKCNIRNVTTFQPNVNFPRNKPNRIQHPNARGLALRDHLLFVAYDAGGLRVLDVSRDVPVEVSRYINRRMFGKQQAYNNIVLDGNRAFIAVDYAGLEIVDITNPRRITQIGWWNPWKANTLANLWFNSLGHANQLGLDRKRQLVYLSAGASELQVVDVRRPKKTRLTHHFGKPSNHQGVWGVTLARETAYLSAVVPFQSDWSPHERTLCGG